jgi:hypothetical protein
MRRERYFLIVLLIVFLSYCSVSNAQDTDTTKNFSDTSITFDTPVKAPAKVKKRLHLKPAGDFDQRFSFIENQGVSIWGYRIGVSVNDKYKVGIGGYFLKQELAGIRHDANGTPINQLTKNVYYGTIYLEPYLLRRKRWEMSMVFELGYGTAFFDSTNKIRGRFLTKTETQHFVPAGMGFSANLIMPEIRGFHFLTYLGINGMIGLRKTVFDTDLKYNFDGWYWSIGSAIFIDKIFSDLTKKKRSKAVAAN